MRQKQRLYDELGDWSKDKLDLLGKYLSAYTTILTSPRQKKWCRGVHYIDGFAGGGKAIDRDTQEFIDASPRIAIDTEPQFSRFVFIEKDPRRVAQLQALKQEFPDRAIEICKGDCNEILVDKVIPSIPPSNERGFLLLDPYALHVDWQTIEKAAEAGAIEIMVKLPLMAIYRTVIRDKREKVDDAQAVRLDRFWGCQDWRDAVWQKSPTLFGPEERKQEHVADVLSTDFQDRLANVFKYVSKYVIMRNTTRAPLYSLIWAGHNKTACKIMNEVFHKYEEQH